MSLIKRIGFGITLGVDPTGGTSFSVLGSVVDGFSGSGPKAIKADTSVLANWYSTYAPCGVEPGSFDFEIAYDPAFSESHTLAILLGTGAVANWQITFQGAVVETFLAYVEGMSREVKRKNLCIAKISLVVAGDPGYKVS